MGAWLCDQPEQEAIGSSRKDVTPDSLVLWPLVQTLPSRQGLRVLEAPRNPATAELRQPFCSLAPHLPPQGPQLSLEDEGSVLNNRLVGLSLGRMHVTALPEPVEITFSHPRQPPVSPHPGWQ